MEEMEMEEMEKLSDNTNSHSHSLTINRYWADIDTFLGRGVYKGKVPVRGATTNSPPKNKSPPITAVSFSLHESQRLLTRRLHKEETMNKLRAQKRGRKMNRLKADRNAFGEFKKLEEADKREKENNGEGECVYE
jgi:hypothetical protein